MSGFADAAGVAARVATGRLGWAPAAFWGATPAELRFALEGLVGTEPRPVAAAAADLIRMQELFPDD
jgi:hypothetical protein